MKNKVYIVNRYIANKISKLFFLILEEEGTNIYYTVENYILLDGLYIMKEIIYPFNNNKKLYVILNDTVKDLFFSADETNRDIAKELIDNMFLKQHKINLNMINKEL